MTQAFEDVCPAEIPADFLSLLDAARRQAAEPVERPDIRRIPDAHPALDRWMKRMGVEAEPAAPPPVDEDARALWRAIGVMRRLK
jgi:hypothetical protein